MRNTRTSSAIGALTLGLALIVSACGSDNTAPQVSTTEHNNADVAFASDMLQHHAQALSMVDLTLDRPLDPEVRQLADAIREAQAPEIEAFNDWLTAWDEEIPQTMRDHSNAGDGGGSVGESMEGMDSDMPGMMSSDAMTALEGAPDVEFERLWLTMMVEHHEGAVEMARTEVGHGRFEPAVDLAREIITSQSGEIETMRTLLG